MLTAAQIMTREVTCAGARDSVRRAMEMLIDQNLSGMPVTDAGGTLLGIVSEYDLILAANTVGDGLDLEHVMHREVIHVAPATPVAEMADLMLYRRIKRLPVLAEDGRLLGIVSRRDVLAALLGRFAT